MKTIKERYLEISKIQYDANKLMWALQSECIHPNKVGVYESQFNEWGCSTDYFIRCECDECGKLWTIYQDEDPIGYNNFDGKVIE